MICTKSPKSIAVFIAILVFAFAVFAQESTPSAPTSSSADVLAEDERLPFMLNEESAAPQEPSSTGLVLKSIGALMLVIGLLFFGTWTLKKLGFGGQKAKGDPDAIALSLLSTLTIGNGRTISTVQFGERVLLVGVTPQSFTLLAEDMPMTDRSEENHRSVAEMLAEEGHSFDDEFEIANRKLNMWRDRGGEA